MDLKSHRKEKENIISELGLLRIINIHSRYDGVCAAVVRAVLECWSEKI